MNASVLPEGTDQTVTWSVDDENIATISSDPDGRFLRIPAIRAKVADTTGAGDTMNGAFAFALARGMDLPAALRFANAAAGIATEKPGAQAGMPTYAEVEARL